MKLIYEIDPFPAVRSNKGSSWTPRTIKYHEKMNKLRLFMMPNTQTIIDALIESRCHIVFQIPVPNSWSKKKKQESIGEFHRSKPDTDNLYKAFTDTLFYLKKQNDSEIPSIHCTKVWGESGKIIVEII